MQSFQAILWAALACLCVLSIAWGATRRPGHRPPMPFFAVQAAFMVVCVALAAQAASLAVLPARMPAYVDALLASAPADAVQPITLTPGALAELEDVRGQVKASVHHVDTTVMPGSRSLFVQVTFGNSDMLLLSIAYRGHLPTWMPVSFGPYDFLVESAVFFPHRLSPNSLIATLAQPGSPA